MTDSYATPCTEHIFKQPKVVYKNEEFPKELMLCIVVQEIEFAGADPFAQRRIAFEVCQKCMMIRLMKTDGDWVDKRVHMKLEEFV